MNSQEIAKIKSKIFVNTLYPLEPAGFKLSDFVFGFDTEFENEGLSVDELTVLLQLKKEKAEILGMTKNFHRKDAFYDLVIKELVDNGYGEWLSDSNLSHIYQVQLKSLCSYFGIDFKRKNSRTYLHLFERLRERDVDEVFSKVFKVDRSGFESVDGYSDYLSYLDDQIERLEERDKSSKSTLISYQLAYYVSGVLHSKIYYTDKLSVADLYNSVMDIARGCRWKKPFTIYFITYFSQAELSHIKEFEHNYIYKEENGISMIEASNTYIGKAKYKGVTLKFYDLFTYFKSGLATVGSLVGLPKTSISKEFKEKMTLLLKSDRLLFEQYAKRDAEIAIKAFKMLADEGEKYNVNILRYPTAPSFYTAIFRKIYLSLPATAVKPNTVNKRYKTKYLFAGSKRVRLLALRSYHGGRNEAYFYGRMLNDLWLYDVHSLYPVASIMQPLPNCLTKWHRLKSLNDIEGVEGYCHVKFKFDRKEFYPNLPIEEAPYLYFPLKGESYCTLSELRKALELGAAIQLIGGYGFYPNEAEINHDLSRYMKDFIYRKENAGNDAEYSLSKLAMNSIIGKTVQRKQVIDLIAISRLLGIPIHQLDTVISKRRDYAFQRYRKIELGNCFCPEWASLILGKARSIMSDLIIANEPLSSVTDSVLLDHKLKSCKTASQLKCGIELKCEADSGLIIRDRAYYLFKDGDIVKKAVNGLGVSVHDEEFDRAIKEYMLSGTELPSLVYRKRLSRFREAYKFNRQWNKDIVVEVHPNYKPSRKRKLEDDNRLYPLIKI